MNAFTKNAYKELYRKYKDCIESNMYYCHNVKESFILEIIFYYLVQCQIIWILICKYFIGM